MVAACELARCNARDRFYKLITPTVFIFLFQNFACILKKLQQRFRNKKIGKKLVPNLKKIQLFLKMYYIVITKKQRNVCYNFFESLYSFAHFKCKGYILYSKLLLLWAVEKKNFCPSAKIKKIISRNFQVSHWIKNTCRLFSK